MEKTNYSRLLQEPKLTASQSCTAPNNVIHLILQTPPASEWRISQPYGNAVYASDSGRELG